MVTMQDVARHAGVSIATVSFVVNNTKPVSPGTRDRVESSMAELGFRRNAVARALASRRTHILAMAYPALEHHLDRSSIEFLVSAAAAASKLDYHLILWPVSNDADELNQLIGQGLVDGVLLMEVQLDDPRATALEASKTPFAMIGRAHDPELQAHVDIDFDTTIEQAMAYLYDLGHRSVVLVTGSQQDSSFANYGPYVRTEAAYLRVAASYGLSPVIMESTQLGTSGREIARRLAAEHPEATAVMIMSESAALGLLAGLAEQGLRVPDDISVMSIFTSPDIAGLGTPQLTIMKSPGTELGRLGVEALIKLLEGDEPGPPQLVPAELMVGGSTGPRTPASPVR